MNTNINRILYLGFILIGTYYTFFTRNYMDAAGAFGIGLAFDPFNPNVKWTDRPMWQKMVLFIHLGITAALFGFGIGLNDK